MFLLMNFFSLVFMVLVVVLCFLVGIVCSVVWLVWVR